jgi:hypothetical protein
MPMIKIIKYLLSFLRNIFISNEKVNKNSNIYHSQFTTLDMLSNQYDFENQTTHIISKSPTLFNEENKSKLDAMRLKKHFTLQTNLLLKPNETQFVGAFSVSTELKTIKKSPFSCNFNLIYRYSIFKYSFFKRRIFISKICYIGI